MTTVIERQQNIWSFQNTISRRLLVWAATNIVAGIWMQNQDNKFLNGVGSQSTSWGAINALIAIGGTLAAQMRAKRTNANDPETLSKEHNNLFRALWINGILDVFYMLGGVWLVRTRGKSDAKLRGMGWGIVIQGAFLFIFDFVHATFMASNKDNNA